MPYVNVRLTEGVTQQQKETVIRGITELLVNELGKNPETTFVVIDEVPTDNWGVGGKTVAERRREK
jgi:4-oxalocrotonate tautomerase